MRKSVNYSASHHLPKLFILLITLFLTDLFALTFVCFVLGGFQARILPISCHLIKN